jgi:hypothetical protein
MRPFGMIVVKGEIHAVQGGRPVTVMWIQYFGFGLRGEPTG